MSMMAGGGRIRREDKAFTSTLAVPKKETSMMVSGMTIRWMDKASISTQTAPRSKDHSMTMSPMEHALSHAQMARPRGSTSSKKSKMMKSCTKSLCADG